MHSRVVLVLSFFALAFIIVLGSFALHLTSASASTETLEADDPLSGIDEVADEYRPRVSNHDDIRDPLPPNESAGEASEVRLTLEERLNADSLATLLHKVHQGFEPEAAGVNNEMIPHLAEMITVVNQHDHLEYLIEISEPDVELARRRAQTLNDVLRLNVLQPSKLHIVGRQGRHAAHVDVSAQ